MKLTNQSRAKRFYNYLADNYTLVGQEYNKYFDTYNGQVKRTLTTLKSMGMIEVWVDEEDPRRWWAAAIVEDEELHADT